MIIICKYRSPETLSNPMQMFYLKGEFPLKTSGLVLALLYM